MEKNSKNKFIFITNWEKHQSTEKLYKIRQQQDERTKRYREIHKASNASVTLKQSDCNATEVEVEVEVEPDKEKDKKEITSSKILNDSLDGKNENSKKSTNESSNENSEKSSIPKKESEFLPKVKEILKHLNDSTGSHFRCTESFKKTVTSRLKDGYTVDDFATVIDKKILEWKGTEFEKYLCPTTLFRASKFDEYLNQTSNCKTNKTPAGISNFKDRE